MAAQVHWQSLLKLPAANISVCRATAHIKEARTQVLMLGLRDEEEKEKVLLFKS